ncbi:MAG: serine/threonine protein kinase [Archangium sp.]|nr:serine/threonine protein kinase [Archangium sp.]
MSEPVTFGRYLLLRRIAAGGMAHVFLALQRGVQGFEKAVALKVVLPEHAANPDFVQMFLDEARVVARLDHANIVRVYDFGESDGRFYLSMEYLPGEDLSSVLQSLRKTKEPMPLAIAADLVASAAAGLHFAHELTSPTGAPLNIVHRDVSPSNLMVTYHGAVKVVDFGVARAASNLSQTASGTMKGKVGYASPEQVRGEELDRRSDVFALGVVLHELLAGERLFKRDTDLAAMHAILTGAVRPLREVRPDVPPALEAIVTKALHLDREARFQTAAELGDALARWLMSVGHVRSERLIADFLARTFPPERRDARLRAANTPGQAGVDQAFLEQVPSHLSPIRSAATAAARPPARASGWGLSVAIVVLGLAFALMGKSLLERPPVVEQVVGEQVGVVFGEPVIVAQAHAEPDEPVAALPLVVAPPPLPPKRVERGRLTLETSPWSEVFFKGRKLGDTPLVDVSLPAGVQVLTLESSGRRHTIEVEIAPGRTTIRKLKL